MKVNNFSEDIKEVKICSGVYFPDYRGVLKKSIHGDELTELMPEVKEVLCTTSKQNVIRGLHFQKEPSEISKFLTCVQGEIMDVFLDIRKDSKNFGKYGVKNLNENDNESIFIPKGFAHGYITLSKVSVVVYLQSGNYNSEFDMAINPLSVGIDWKVDKPIVSEKDLNALTLEEYKKIINY